MYLVQFLSVPQASETTKQKLYIDLTTDDDGDDEYANSAHEQVYGNASHEDYQEARLGREGPRHIQPFVVTSGICLSIWLLNTPWLIVLFSLSVILCKWKRLTPDGIRWSVNV